MHERLRLTMYYTADSCSVLEPPLLLLCACVSLSPPLPPPHAHTQPTRIAPRLLLKRLRRCTLRGQHGAQPQLRRKLYTIESVVAVLRSGTSAWAPVAAPYEQASASSSGEQPAPLVEQHGRQAGAQASDPLVDDTGEDPPEAVVDTTSSP